jgi:hypothetical protein
MHVSHQPSVPEYHSCIVLIGASSFRRANESNSNVEDEIEVNVPVSVGLSVLVVLGRVL